MITFEEKDKLLSYILSVKSDHFIIDYQDVFPNKEVLDFEFFLMLKQFVKMGLLEKSIEMTGGISRIILNADIYDYFDHGGFRAQEEILKASLEKLGYELEKLSESSDPIVLSRIDKIAGITTSIATAIGIFSK